MHYSKKLKISAMISVKYSIASTNAKTLGLIKLMVKSCGLKCLKLSGN